MKNMLDGHGWQLKSLKSKKFRGHNCDTLACRVPNHFHLSLLCLQISLIILKSEQKQRKETVQNNCTLGGAIGTFHNNQIV